MALMRPACQSAASPWINSMGQRFALTAKMIVAGGEMTRRPSLTSRITYLDSVRNRYEDHGALSSGWDSLVRAYGVTIRDEGHPEHVSGQADPFTTRLVDTVTTPMLLKTVRSGKIDRKRLITHYFKLDQMLDAYDTFGPTRTGRRLIRPSSFISSLIVTRYSR
jgi:hypothetical protein